MRARDLARRQPSVWVGAPASEAARALAETDVRALLVVDEGGRLVGVLSDSDLLRALLPSYVEEAGSLAGVLEEEAAELLWRQIQDRRVEELLQDREVFPQVNGGDTLVEVASVMVRSRASLVGVVEGERLVGGITISDLLSRLLGRR